MKKRYKKPNICAFSFDILDLIQTSDGYNVDPGDDDWEDDPTDLNGGFNTSNF